MTLPSDSDFNLYAGALIDQNDWDHNFEKVVSILASGSYSLNMDQITANTYNGLPTSGEVKITTGESIEAGDIVRIQGGLAYLATNATSAGITAIIGVSKTTTASGLTATITTSEYTAYTSLVLGNKYYVGVNGAVQSTPGTNYPVEIGLAISSTTIKINVREDLTPAGTIMAYTLGTKPNGTLIANGGNVSRIAYARLFDVWGTTYGAGDGSTTFGTPNFEGEFLRGLDSSRTIGDVQADATAVNGLATVIDGLHHHLMFDETLGVGYTPPTSTSNVTHSSPQGNDYSYSMSQSPYPTSPPELGRTNTAGDHTHSLTGDTETRPANKSVLYCIKL